MRPFLFIVIVLVLFSCTSRHKERTDDCVEMKGMKVEIGDDASLFEIVYADDSLLVASVLSPTHLLESYDIGKKSAPHKFLRIGRGPKEVLNANIKSRNDTLFVMSYGMRGFQNLMKIPVSGIQDMPRWNSLDLPDWDGMLPGRDFDVLHSSLYVVTGSYYEQENILSVLSEKSGVCTPLPFWPEDGRDDIPPLTKQLIYTRGARVFSNGDKILYSCNEGRYFTILDISSGDVSEIFIYDEYPEYEVSSDGINPSCKPGTKLGGIVCATDSLIFLSLLNCQLADGKYIPSDYNGYPPYYNDRIEVYDWDGEYQCTYVTDIPFSTFYANDKFIYALTINKETYMSEVYRYRIL